MKVSKNIVKCTITGCGRPADLKVIWQIGLEEGNCIFFCQGHYDINHRERPHAMSEPIYLDTSNLENNLSKFWEEFNS